MRVRVSTDLWIRSVCVCVCVCPASPPFDPSPLYLRVMVCIYSEPQRGEERAGVGTPVIDTDYSLGGRQAAVEMSAWTLIESRLFPLLRQRFSLIV